ncbi:hypothetical protein Bca52824_033266 [Brassica carinata]|uniref:Cytosolic endo-beta-N-acetylglucosaminidase TIM barrel domain-containing protein n=1 Tax=Brassica carinata TaxID=52824 RepID=A0A8X7SFN3_BRACI|nr:hypothetical protein Bca52824_033266 [Brassica carinata]
MGIDVFGRGSFGGGQWTVNTALDLLKRNNVSAAVLAPGWVYETAKRTDEGGSVLNLGQDALDFQGSSLLVSGSREDVGDWQIHLRSQNLLETHYSGFKTPHIC